MILLLEEKHKDALRLDLKRQNRQGIRRDIIIIKNLFIGND